MLNDNSQKASEDEAIEIFEVAVSEIKEDWVKSHG